MAGAVQETSPPGMVGGQGANFLRGVTCVASRTFSWQAQYLREMEWQNRETHWHEAICSALNLKEASQKCFGFDVVNFKSWLRFAKFLRFGAVNEVSPNCFNLELGTFFLRKSCRMNGFILDLSTSTLEGSLAELIASFQIDDR